MRFSEAFAIERTDEDDWFDPHLTIDTKLFIDPLLLLELGGEWAGAHDELIAHFVHCYGLVARATGANSLSAVAARRLLTFPEPSEIGLGYTAQGTSGAGAGAQFANRMADGIAVAIRAGLANPEHIEEIGILNEGIGADRISDAVANVLKSRLIRYTQDAATRHSVPLEDHRVRHARVNLTAGRWVDETVALPTNPTTGKPIILVPQALLNELPILNADDWFDSNLNVDVRLQMNLTVGAAVRKADIVRWARTHPDRVRTWAREQTSRADLAGYDFESDPIGVVQWDREPARWASEHPLEVPQVVMVADLVTLVGKTIEQFQHFIEEQRGWKLLHNDDGSYKPEEAAQLAYLGMAQPYLRLYNVEIDREVELGRGPVDFKAASGASARLLVEMKKEHNGKFWNGIEAQLPSYLRSDGSKHGWYVALRFRSNRPSDVRLRALPTVVSRVARETGADLRFTVIDARPKESASNIDPAERAGMIERLEP
jgi:hypothetical protein